MTVRAARLDSLDPVTREVVLSILRARRNAAARSEAANKEAPAGVLETTADGLGGRSRELRSPRAA